MSIDRIQSVPGRLTLSPEVTPTNSYPGEVGLGPNAGIAAGAAASTGGAIYNAHTPKSGSAASIAASGTITHNNHGVAVVATSTAADKAGVIVQVGAYPGQRLCIINNSANTLTMAAVGTSNVANGTGCVISALAAVDLVWNALDSKWYQVRAA